MYFTKVASFDLYWRCFFAFDTPSSSIAERRMNGGWTKDERESIENRTRTDREPNENRTRTEREPNENDTEKYHRNCWLDCYTITKKKWISPYSWLHQYATQNCPFVWRNSLIFNTRLWWRWKVMKSGKAKIRQRIRRTRTKKAVSCRHCEE